MDDTLSQKRQISHAFPIPKHQTHSKHQNPKRVEDEAQTSSLSLGSEVGLKLRGLSNLSALAVASVGRSLAAGAGVARGLVVLVAGAAAGALAGRTLVWRSC
jgi:hypothetical protein